MKFAVDFLNLRINLADIISRHIKFCLKLGRFRPDGNAASKTSKLSCTGNPELLHLFFLLLMIFIYFLGSFCKFLSKFIKFLCLNVNVLKSRLNFCPELDKLRIFKNPASLICLEHLLFKHHILLHLRKNRLDVFTVAASKAAFFCHLFVYFLTRSSRFVYVYARKSFLRNRKKLRNHNA